MTRGGARSGAGRPKTQMTLKIGDCVSVVQLPLTIKDHIAGTVSRIDGDTIEIDLLGQEHLVITKEKDEDDA